MRPVWLVFEITLFFFHTRPHGPCTFHGTQFTIGLTLDICLPIKEFKVAQNSFQHLNFDRLL